MREVNTMKEQNIYDDVTFFDGYFHLRKECNNYNDLLEQPAVSKMLPDVSGKVVLDLGCGYGGNCIDFINRGASKVVGVDLSSKMLDIAQKEASHPQIEYRNMNMSELNKMNENNEKYDLVYSSLAFHYVDRFDILIEQIYQLLNEEGVLLFSQEHPLTTATIIDEMARFNIGGSGKEESYTFSNYNQPGMREIEWFTKKLTKYHRPMGELITTVAKTGFVIQELCEPEPNSKAIELLPGIEREFIKPSFMIMKAIKANKSNDM